MQEQELEQDPAFTADGFAPIETESGSDDMNGPQVENEMTPATACH
jgi:hypothetical protein